MTLERRWRPLPPSFARPLRAQALIGWGRARRLDERQPGGVGDPHGVLEEDGAGRRELHALAAPLEEARADLQLEGTHATRHAGLAQPERGRRAAEGPPPRHPDEQ